jgi:hypothetical protein
LLDKILYDVDRAIDLYAVGRFDFGPPERRAAAYGYLIQWLLFGVQLNTAGAAAVGTYSTEQLLLTHLTSHFGGGGVNYPPQTFWQQMLSSQPPHPPALPLPLNTYSAPNPQTPKISYLLYQILNLLQPQLHLASAGINKVVNELNAVGTFVTPAVAPVGVPLTVATLTTAWNGVLGTPRAGLTTPQRRQLENTRKQLEHFFDVMNQELYIQRDLEAQWRQMVATIANDFIGTGDVFAWVDQAIEGAIGLVGGKAEPLEAIRLSLPPQFEMSLSEIDRKIH